MELSMLAARTRRTRETHGPTPHSVSVWAKPTLKKPKEYLILERRRQEEAREEADAMVSYNKQFDLKTTWERETDKKIQKNTVKRRVNDLLQREQLSLEERRDKLREMLREEEESYVAEVAQQVETPIERQAKMRERAKQLREKREVERLEIVQDKLDQRWRDGCEELRSILSKKHQDDVCQERDEQIRVKREQQYRQHKEEEMYAQLWKEDMLAKAKREEMEAMLQIERNREMLKTLTLQKAAKAQEEENSRNLKEQEAQLLREQAALRAIEEQCEREEKRREQEATKGALDRSLKLKLRRKAKEVQEELAMDMKILQDLLAQTDDEKQKQAMRKKELNDEMQCYCSYLEEQKREEERREKEVDAMVQAEVEKIWAKRLKQWKAEKDARKKLMQDVLETRKKQIEYKMSVLAMQKEEEEQEKQAILRNLKEHRVLEEQQKQQRKQSNVLYQSDLLMQMEYQGTKEASKLQQAQQELDMAEAVEAEYQKKLQKHLESPYGNKLHPQRKSPLQTK